MEDKITLDREVFKALSSDTRVNILKSLGRRRKTLSELSKEFGMSVSTIKEHLDNLCKVDLIVQKDEGHKWKYYELTLKGKNVLNPSEAKIWIVIGLAGLAVILTAYDFLRKIVGGPVQYVAKEVGSRAPMAAGEKLTETVNQTIVPETAPAPPATVTTELFLPHIHLIALIIFTAILGVAIGYMLTKRKVLADF